MQSTSADHYQYLAYDSRTRRLLLEPAPTPEPVAWAIVKIICSWALQGMALGLSVYGIFFFLGLMSG